MIAQVNGIEIYYERLGQGRPLVMVHGSGEDHRIFREAAEYLKKDFACFLVDSRGHGRSTRAGTLHYEDMAGDMAALIGSLGLRDVVFYGFSDGGIVGLLAAARCPQITTLIVSGANLTPEGIKPGWLLLYRVLYLFRKDPKITLILTEPHITKAQLGRITARTLVLAGSRDMIREEETRRISRGIPGAKLIILRGEDHGSYIVHKKRIGQIIRKFVEMEARG